MQEQRNNALQKEKDTCCKIKEELEKNIRT